MTAINDSIKLKTVRINDKTHEKIIQCGKMGETMDDVIDRVFDYYIEKAFMGKAKK
jgi:hypothetical protein